MPITEFVPRVVEFKHFYPTASPFLSIVINIKNAGEELARHFDTNGGVVPLGLQITDKSGHFQYTPYMR